MKLRCANMDVLKWCTMREECTSRFRAIGKSVDVCFQALSSEVKPWSLEWRQHCAKGMSLKKDFMRVFLQARRCTLGVTHAITRWKAAKVAEATGQWHALIGCYGRHRRLVARSN